MRLSVDYVLLRLFAFAFLLFIACAGPLCAADQATVGAVAGSVTTSDATPIARATVTLQAAKRGNRCASIRKDTFGSAALLRASTPRRRVCRRVQSARTTTDPSACWRYNTIDLVLIRSSTSLTTIGSVSATGTAAISTSSVPAQILNTQDYAARGFTRVGDVLEDALSATVLRQGSGSPAAPESVALRGPDPTETLIDIDGHEVNNSNSGDFDLSLLDPADFENEQVVYGVAPSSLIGPSTIGGAINVRTLEPTATTRGLLRFSAGSFNSFGGTFQSTGTADRLGYAVSVHRTGAQNEVSNSTIIDTKGDTSVVGSSVAGTSALAKLRYSFGKSKDGYAELTFRDRSAIRDVSAALSSILLPGRIAPAPSGPVDQSRVSANPRRFCPSRSPQIR